VNDPDDAPGAPRLVPAPPPERRGKPSIPPMPIDEIGELARCVRVGLLRRPRTLPMQWMLDDVGASLYEAWMHMPECGLARAEARLLDRNAQRIADAVQATAVVELGPTSGRRKARLLESLARRAPVTYAALDVSAQMADRSLRDLGEVPGVSATGRAAGIADVASALATRTGPALVMWLGTGVGTLDQAQLEYTLAAIRGQLVRGDALLLGTDLLKHESVLVRAYDDAAGIAAAFDRAYLARINRELGGELDVRWFRHEARWNEGARRIELHLVATQPVHARVNVAGIVLHMEYGETIWTASAHKLLPHEPDAIGARASFAAAAQWLDPTWPYALTLLTVQ
jgi:L-histidine N-alpha-methyltransferase